MEMPDGTEPDSARSDSARSDSARSDSAETETENAETDKNTENTENTETTDGEAPARKKEDAGGGSRGKPARKLLRELLIIVVAAVALTVLVRTFVVQVYRIPSASMENTVLIGDRVLVNKLVYRFRGIARGDIVVFRGTGRWSELEGPPPGPPPSNPVVRFFDAVLADVGLRSDSTYFIKRVIGLPGDHVACCTSGMVTVNGVALHETGYLYPGTTPAHPFTATVPAGDLWVMGDWRDNSSDSRVNGPIPESSVTGRAFLIAWPLSRFGDLPIPQTFKQAGLSRAAAANPAAVTATAVTGVLVWRRTTRRRRQERAGGRRRGRRPGRR
jgi:signal peptidase I